MEEKKYTVNEVLQSVINILGNIAVPRYLNEQIGVPIDDAIHNIVACIEANKKAEDSIKEEDKHEQ